MIPSFCDARTTLVPVVSLHTGKIRVSPMRIRAFQASLRADTFSHSTSLGTALNKLFMEVMRYFHEHLDVEISIPVCEALQRIHDGAQSLFTSLDGLFVDLRTVEACVASGDPAVALALKEALEALAAMRH
jgi:hypothetical protein